MEGVLETQRTIEPGVEPLGSLDAEDRLTNRWQAASIVRLQSKSMTEPEGTMTMPTPFLLILVRSSLLVRLLNGRPLLWMEERIRQDYQTNIRMILGALIDSNDPRYSERLLSCLSYGFNSCHIPW